MSYKAVLFDWDGCLSQSLETWLKICKQVLNEYGAGVTEEDVAPLLGSGRMAAYFNVSEPDECTQEIRTRAAQKLGKDTPLYPGVKATLKKLAENKKLAIVSNGQRPILQQSLSAHGLEPYFSAIITRNDVTEKKPHPEGIQKALELFKCSPQDAVMVGDSVNDVYAAQAAAVDSFLFYPAAHQKFYSKRVLKSTSPTVMFNDFTKLHALVA